MKTYIPNAEKKRAAIGVAQSELPDSAAIVAIDLFDHWSGESVAYAVGTRVQYDGLLYKCLTAHQSQPTWTPTDAPSLWVRGDDPGEEWPEWRQPEGSTQAYPQGAKVTHNAKHWVSDVDNNVWEPSVYGWSEQEG